MNTLTAFSEKEKQYDRYQARQEYLRIQRSIQMELEQEREAKRQALKSKEAEKQRAEDEKQCAEDEKQRAENEKQRADAALAEIERLKILLNQQQTGNS